MTPMPMQVTMKVPPMPAAAPALTGNTQPRTWRRRQLIGWLVTSAGLLAGPPSRAAEPADSVQITGDVLRPALLDAAVLRAFAAAAQASFKTSREIDGVKQDTLLRGVRLRALLEQAGLAERDRYDWRKTVLIASATDGYRVVFSWPELFNTDSGAQTLVVYERDGAPLAASEGPLAIAVPGDLRSGPRHVKWLNRIEVRVLRD